MTEPNEPRALADLARALRAASLLIRSMSSNGGDETIAEELADSTHYAREAGNWDDDWDWEQVAAILDAWQAPPSPDAGAAFAEAVEHLERCAFLRGVIGATDQAVDGLAAAKAALLAFAPAGVRITTAEVEAGARALWGRRGGNTDMWAALTENYREMSLTVLEAAFLKGGAHE